MKLARMLLVGALAVVSLSAAACAGSTSDGTGASEDDLTGLGTGTWVVSSRPWGSHYLARLTLAAGKKFEADIVSSDGETSLIAGRYDILPARPNNPDSPVKSDKPTLYLTPDSGAAPATFELDRLPAGELRLYHSVRRVSFEMKKDPTWKPTPTDALSIACTGSVVDATVTLDQAQNRRGTLKIKRKSGADEDDGPPAATVALTKNEGGGSRDYVYFEGQSGEEDYYVNMIKADFERKTGNVTLHLTWARGGQEWGVPLTCAFTR